MNRAQSVTHPEFEVFFPSLVRRQSPNDTLYFVLPLFSAECSLTSSEPYYGFKAAETVPG
jgi:hypothetical protein